MITCNGCGECIPNCPEWALQVIDGKARLISDIFCDGLGSCIGHCPQGTIITEEREAEEYDEKKTMENIVKAGKNTIIAHLKELVLFYLINRLKLKKIDLKKFLWISLYISINMRRNDVYESGPCKWEKQG